MRPIFAILVFAILVGFAFAKKQVTVPADTTKQPEIAVPQTPPATTIKAPQSAPVETAKKSVAVPQTPVVTPQPTNPSDQAIKPAPIASPTTGTTTTIAPSRGTTIASPQQPHDTKIKGGSAPIQQPKSAVTVAPTKQAVSSSAAISPKSLVVVDYLDYLSLDSTYLPLQGIKKFILNIPAYTPNLGDSARFRSDIEAALFTNDVNFIRYPTNWETVTTPILSIYVTKVMGFSNSSDSIMQVRIEVNQDVRPLEDGMTTSSKTLLDVPIWAHERYLLLNNRYNAYDQVHEGVIASLQYFIAVYKAANDPRVEFERSYRSNIHFWDGRVHPANR